MKKDTINTGNEEFDSETGELLNKVEEIEVEVIEDELPNIVVAGGTHIKTNTVQLENELIKYLEKFDVAVSAETEKDASKKATELNKLALHIDKERKAVASLIKKPADLLKSKADKLITLIQEKRQGLLKGVQVFKDERFELIRRLLNSELDRLYFENGIEIEYQTVDIELLVNEGSLATTNLTKKAIEAIEGMAFKCKSTQDNVTIRLLQLEKTCIDAGLEVVFIRNDIEHIIKLPDNEYLPSLNKMIEDRVALEKSIKDAQEAKRLSDEAIVENAKAEEGKKEETIKVAKAVELKKVSKKTVSIIAVFEVEVSDSKPDLEVLAGFQSKLSKEYTSLKTVALGE